MHKVLILGAGKIGALISGLLAESGDYDVHVADVNESVARSVVRGARPRQPARPSASTPATRRRCARAPARAPGRRGDLEPALSTAMSLVAEAARAAGAHYFDLTEDVAVTRAVRTLAARRRHARSCRSAASRPASSASPANALIGHFDELRSVKLRVGALPQHPNNVLKYSLTWSTEGLINEYGNPCEAIVERPRRSKSRRSRASRKSRSTARSTRRSTPRAGSARSRETYGAARRDRWTTRPSAIPGTARRCAC